MRYKNTRKDLISFQKDMDTLMTEALQHMKGDYDRAVDMIFTPLEKANGASAAELTRQGYPDQASTILREMVRTARIKRELAAQKKANSERLID